MASVAYKHWIVTSALALDELESAHAAVGGTSPGRRYATRQINHAYAVLLSAEFQEFCRSLHRECVEHILTLTPSTIQEVVRVQFLRNRLLDQGNPNPGNIGADFNRLEIQFWDQVRLAEPNAVGWQQQLQELSLWRNAIAHNDFDPKKLGSRMVLRLAEVRSMRRACRRLARTFDSVMFRYLAAKVGTPPW